MTPSAAPPQIVRTPWGLVVLLAAMTAFGAMSIDMYLPALPEMASHLNASAEAAQATVAVFFLGMGFGQLLYGPASDLWGRRPAILAGIAVYIAASLVCMAATNVEILLVARLAQALGGCAGIVIGRAVVRDRFDHLNAARILSLLSLVMGLAPLLAPFAGAAILHFAGWRPIFGTLAAFGLAVGLAVLVFLRESRSAESAAKARAENPFRAYRALLGTPRFIGYLLAGGLNGACLLTYIASSPAVLMGHYGVSPSAFGWYFGANALAIMGGAQFNRLLLRRFVPDDVLAIVALFALLSGAVLLLAAVTGIGGMALLLGALFCVLASYGVMTGNTMAGALSIDPHRAGSASALMGTGSYGLGALAATLVAALSDGSPTAFAAVMLLCLGGSSSALFLLALPKERRPF